MPIAVGLSDVPQRRFLVFNLIGAAVWVACLGVGGFYFGATLELWMGDLKRYELWIVLTLAVLGASLWMLGRLRLHRRLKVAASRVIGESTP